MATSGSKSTRLNWNDVRWETPAAADIFFKLAEQPQHAGTDGATLLPGHRTIISKTPHLNGMALNVYRHGLEIGDHPSIIMTGGATMGALIGLPVGLDGLYSFFTDNHASIVELVISLFGLIVGYFALRWDTSGYRYHPILFDRAARKVHIFVDRTSLLIPWPIVGGGKYEIRSYDWDCVRAQIKRFTLFSGSVARTEAQLQLVVLKAPDDPTIIDQAGLGYTTTAMVIQPLINAWEHLRRFMQHEGPLLVEGDQPWQEPSQTSLWGALTFSQPFIGPGGKENWQHRDAMMWLGQLVAGVLFPITMAVGLLRWTVYHLKSKPKWPASIRASIGDGPLRGEALANWRNRTPGRRPHKA